MWELMKAEIRYNWVRLLAVYGAAWLFWVIYLFDPSGSFQLYGLPAVFLSAVLLGRAAEEKRLRTLMQLPLSSRQTSVAPLISIVGLFYLGQLSIWPVQLAVAEMANRSISFLELLTVNGLTLSAVTLAIVALDLRFYRRRGWQFLAWGFLGLGVIGLVSFMFQRRSNPELAAAVTDWLSGSIVLAAAANLVLLGTIALRVVVFGRRVRYLE